MSLLGQNSPAVVNGTLIHGPVSLLVKHFWRC